MPRGAISDVVENDIVCPSFAGKVVCGVVNGLVSTKLLDQLSVTPATNARNVSSKVSCELHGIRPDAARRAVDEHSRAGSDTAMITQALQRRESGDWKSCRVFE